MANRHSFEEKNIIGERLYSANGERYVFGKISLIFAPKEGDEITDMVGISLHQLARQPYHFTFSEFSNGEHIEIEASDIVNSIASGVDDEPYGGHLIITTEFTELELGISNHTLTTRGVFRAPIRATHVTLWFQENQASEREFIRRVELSSFEAWNRFFQPIIDTVE